MLIVRPCAALVLAQSRCRRVGQAADVVVTATPVTAMPKRHSTTGGGGSKRKAKVQGEKKALRQLRAEHAANGSGLPARRAAIAELLICGSPLPSPIGTPTELREGRRRLTALLAARPARGKRRTTRPCCQKPRGQAASRTWRRRERTWRRWTRHCADTPPSPPLLCWHPRALLAEPHQREGMPPADRLSVLVAARLDSAFGTGLNGSLLVEDIM